jgi:small subunit ribosomal protein S20
MVSATLAAAPARGPLNRLTHTEKPNIQQQIKRVRIAEREREENLRYRSTVKTLAKRLESAVAEGDKDAVETEHLNLVRTIDKAASRGALHKNTAARRKARAARLRSGSDS